MQNFIDAANVAVPFNAVGDVANVPAIPVGLTDKVHVADEAAAVIKPADTRSRIEQLVAERKVWEIGACYKSNVELYALLGKCYAFYAELSGNAKESVAARKVLNEVLSAKGYSFNESTHVRIPLKMTDDSGRR